MPSSTRQKNRPAYFSSSSMYELLESRRFLSADIVVEPNINLYAAGGSVAGYTPAQIRAAYGFDEISLNNSIEGDGAGQTIAIVDAYNDPNILSDLKTFDKQFSLTDPPSFKQVSQTGGSTSSIRTSGDWSAEMALDVEWAHVAAPGANIILVEAKDSSLTNLLAAVDYARHITDVSVVSMSWGTSEFFGQTQYDSFFTTPAGHTPVTFIASSGDDGARFGPSWPSSSANVLAVGGTTLSSTAETAWSGSGGGASRVVSAPSYQTGVTGSATRTTPDVSFNANPNTGFAVYSSVADSSGISGWSVVGGTSAAAPQWAGLVAIANQSRALAGLGTLDGATGTLPALYSAYNSATTYSADFNDITAGSNGNTLYGFAGRFGRFRAISVSSSATVGYDRVTGLGTPNASAIVATLSSASVTSTTTATSTRAVTTRLAQRAVSVAETVVAVSEPKHELFAAPARQALELPTEIDVNSAAATAAARSSHHGGNSNALAQSSDAAFGSARISLTQKIESRATGAARGEVGRLSILDLASVDSGDDANSSFTAGLFSSRRIQFDDSDSPTPASVRRRANPITAGVLADEEPFFAFGNKTMALLGLTAVIVAHLGAHRREAERRAATVNVDEPRMNERDSRFVS